MGAGHRFGPQRIWVEGVSCGVYTSIELYPVHHRRPTHRPCLHFARALTHFVLAWGPAVLWAGVLFLSSSTSDVIGASLFDWVPAGDKLAHLVVYGILGALLAHGRRRQGEISRTVLILAGALYGALDEWHQSFVPGRQVSALDWVADLCGVAAGYWLASSLLSPRVSVSEHGDR